jgi:hypothetical protein
MVDSGNIAKEEMDQLCWPRSIDNISYSGARISHHSPANL